MKTRCSVSGALLAVLLAMPGREAIQKMLVDLCGTPPPGYVNNENGEPQPQLEEVMPEPDPGR
jgi:hypothetical protein